MLVFAIQESGEEIDGWPNLLFFSPPQPSATHFSSSPTLNFYQLRELKEKRVSRSAQSAAHICRYFLLEFHQGFHLKCKRQPCPPEEEGTDTTAAVDIVLYNAAVLS